jgi:hypothetical protein
VTQRPKRASNYREAVGGTECDARVPPLWDGWPGKRIDEILIEKL